MTPTGAAHRSHRLGLRLGRTAALVAIVAVLAAGCGETDDGDAADATTTTVAATTTAAEATTTTETDTTTTTAGSTEDDPWNADAQEFRGQAGEFDFECPAGGTENTIWGTEIYTDDSSVCTAAVHVGLITFAEGGDVTIETMEGQELYMGSVGNGITSSDYGPWQGSFSFPAAPPDSGDFEAGPESWTRNALAYAGEVGDTFSYMCGPGGEAANVWGTDTYTADSSVCTAAVHAGLTTFEEGGQVTFEIIEGLEAYEGSVANGVTTSEYGPFDPAFEFSEFQGGEGG